MCYFLEKIKNLLRFTLEKITCCAKTCPEEKIPAPPPPGYQIVCPLYKSASASSPTCTCMLVSTLLKRKLADDCEISLQMPFPHNLYYLLV